MSTIHVTSLLDAPAHRVWAALQSPATFLYVTKGLLGMPALAGRTDPWRPGEVVTGWLFLFHVVPFSHHRVQVMEIDHEAMTFRAHERGGMLRAWLHSFTVVAEGPAACRYTDTVEIDAGALSQLIAFLARWFYRYRHRRWQKLVRRHLRTGSMPPSRCGR
jgi:hypothetical protein